MSSGLLGLAVVCGHVTTSEAGIRDLFVRSPKPAQAEVIPISKTAEGPRSAALARLAAKRQPNQLLAQADSPLDRLKQRNAEERFRQATSPDLDPFEPSPVEPRDKDLARPEKSATTNRDYEPRELPEPSPFEPPAARIAALPQDAQPNEERVPEPVTSPALLRRITEIQPYFDYQPASALGGEVCWNLCPRPDGMPCKPDENGNLPECPSEVKISDAAYSNRMFADCLYQWRATDHYHNPLYFEDPALERYGHVHHECVQPFVSVARFGVQLVGLPYQMTIDPVCKKMYNLGYYRPGECAPKKYYRIPWNTEAAVNTAGVWTALFFIFP